MYEKRNTKPSYYIHVEALDETNNSLFKCNIDEVKLYDRQVCSSLDYQEYKIEMELKEHTNFKFEVDI